MIAILFSSGAAAFVLAYFIYGRFLDRRMQVTAQLPTPAHVLQDNLDYVPTRPVILFGHHFSSIAGAGPIVGPIIAALAFGWAPVFFWIVLGAIFVGGVHDFGSLMASIRHQGRSVGQICRDLLSPLSYKIFLWFIWLTMVYILIVFLDLTANTFAPVLPPEVQNTETGIRQIHISGAVASASVIYLALAVLFGLAVYRFKLPPHWGTLVFVPLMFAGLYLGHRFPITADHVPAIFGNAKNTWAFILLIYCFAASTLPVWVLLQPRDYLSSFLLYACLIGGGIGLLLSSIRGGITVSYPAFVTWHDPQLQYLYPALFVTVACGAVSGFHSLVASGTTAKQLDAEKHARPVAYGGMLVEGVLALIALASVMILAEKPSGQTPVSIFANALGTMLAACRVPSDLATTFGMLAVSTFLLTTLDTCTRLSRFVLEELFNTRGTAARFATTLASLMVPAVMVFRQIPGPGGKLMPAWQAIWPAFGVTNQLLAALAMLVVFLWLFHQQRSYLFILIPMLFMATTTVTALTQLVIANLFRHGSLLVGYLSLVLEVLALLLFANAAWRVGRRLRTSAYQEGATQRGSAHAVAAS